MTFSIITVNLNDAQGLRKTIRSVVGQSFRDYEFIVIDGGSTDGSTDVLEEFRDSISYSVSEKDSGIYNGMNKGIRVAKGEYLCFLNSGDTFCNADVLRNVSTGLGTDVVVGRINFIDSKGVCHKDFQRKIRKMTPQNFKDTGIPHQASFIRRTLFEKFGLYDEAYRISADWKFFLQALAIGKSTYRYIPVTVADFDGSGISSRNNRLMMDEITKAYRELVPDAGKPAFKKRIMKTLSEIKNFGLVFVFKTHVLTRIHRGKRYRQGLILDYLSRKYSQLVRRSEPEGFKPMGDDFPIWVCWLQGEKAMPPVVKKCYDEMKKYWGEERVKLITESNIATYISLPGHILSRFERNRFSRTHYSDILRVFFLSEYGGLWMDSTILMTGCPDISDSAFFTIKGEMVDDSYASDYKWTGYCLGACAHNPLFDDLKQLLTKYWSDHDRLIDYFILDYCIRLVYEADPDVKALIDSVPLNNPDVAFLQEHLNEAFNQEEFERVCSTTILHKLTWKGKLLTRTESGEQTYFGHILGR